LGQIAVVHLIHLRIVPSGCQAPDQNQTTQAWTIHL